MAGNGQFLALSIRGFSPLFEEMREAAKTNPKIYFQEHRAPEGADVFSEDVWHAANPGLASGIKSIEFMRDAAEMAKDNPSEEYFWRTLASQSGTGRTRQRIPSHNRRLEALLQRTHGPYAAANALWPLISARPIP